MHRHFATFFLMATICMSGLITAPLLAAEELEKKIQINTPEEAAKFAATLANEKALGAFGVSPFSPDSYPAQRTGSRWYWGKIEPPGIGGYSAEVEFNTDGSDQKVRAVLHTDTNFKFLEEIDIPIQKEVIEQKDAPPENTGDMP